MENLEKQPQKRIVSHNFWKWVRATQGTSRGYSMCWTFTNYYHLFSGLCQLRWYWASMPVERTVPCWPSPRLPFTDQRSRCACSAGTRRRQKDRLLAEG